MEKKELRTEIQSKLAQISTEQYKEYSTIITEKLLTLESVRQASTIGVTLSNRPEVDTTSLIEKLWQSKKRVVVPKCNPKDRSMQFYEIQSFDQLETVYMNLREPIPEKTLPISSEHIQLIIVPGVVYDLHGYRIGFGGGYYDRYLDGFDGNLISLAFDLQIVEKVPRQPYDIPVNLIVTEQRTIDSLYNRKGHAH